jgi:HAMP domain-containing protein/HPt (histidine-containing phosphotransfer) domain-containing protein
LTVGAPIFRDNQVIGVIGADVAVDTMTISIDSEHHAAHISNVAVFYSGGRIFYSPKLEYAEESIDTLGFYNTELIREAFDNREPLFLSDEYCIFAEARALIFFQPVYVKDYDESLFLYVSTPRSVLYESLLPILAIIVSTSVIVFAFLLFLFIYVIRAVSYPINQLTLAAKAISQGDIEIAIDYSPDDRNEIGLLSQSLHTMVEQFRVNALNMEQDQREAAIKSQIENFVTVSGSRREIFEGLAAMLCKYFNVFKTTIVYVNAGDITAFSNISPPYEFLAHDQAEALLTGRRLVFLNTQAISSHNISFTEPVTKSLCLIPLMNDVLLGYIIFESNTRLPFIEGSEQIMMYISEIISGWIAKKEWMPEKTEEEPEAAGKSPVMSRLQEIDGLYVGFALAGMGGLYDTYEKTVNLTARLLPEAVKKMDKHISEGNIKNFTVEVHGIKGVLRSIGATKLGGDASDLEHAGLEEDEAFCENNYPTFRESLTEFARQLNLALESDKVITKTKISEDILLETIAKTKYAAECYDAMGALELLAPLKDFSFNEGADELLQNVIFALEEFNCEGAIININKMEEVYETHQ